MIGERTARRDGAEHLEPRHREEQCSRHAFSIGGRAAALNAETRWNRVTLV